MIIQSYLWKLILAGIVLVAKVSAGARFRTEGSGSHGELKHTVGAETDNEENKVKNV